MKMRIVCFCYDDCTTKRFLYDVENQDSLKETLKNVVDYISTTNSCNVYFTAYDKTVSLFHHSIYFGRNLDNIFIDRIILHTNNFVIMGARLQKIQEEISE